MTQRPAIDITALSNLARLEVSEEEKARLEKEIPDILAFVETVQGIAGEAPPVAPSLRNVMRADDNAIESGMYTERILAAAPARTGDRIAVKQVVTRKDKK